MTIQRSTTTTAVLLAVSGIALAGWGPGLAAWFGVPLLPPADPAVTESMAWWRLASFVRLAGMALLAVGAILSAVRGAVLAIGARRFAGTIACVALLTALLALGQQIAIWRTPAGAALVVLFAAPGIAYGWAALRGARSGA